MIDHTPWRLREIAGLGEKKIQKIKQCWQEQQSIRKVMVFLRGYNVSPAYAQKIYKKHQENSILKTALFIQVQLNFIFNKMILTMEKL